MLAVPVKQEVIIEAEVLKSITYTSFWTWIRGGSRALTKDIGTPEMNEETPRIPLTLPVLKALYGLCSPVLLPDRRNQMFGKLLIAKLRFPDNFLFNKGRKFLSPRSGAGCNNVQKKDYQNERTRE
jgi:hypothetical protein